MSFESRDWRSLKPPVYVNNILIDAHESLTDLGAAESNRMIGVRLKCASDRCYSDRETGVHLTMYNGQISRESRDWCTSLQLSRTQ